MKNVKVLGMGCAKCTNTLKLIEEVARNKHQEIVLNKIDDLQEIMSYNIISTPAVVIDGHVVHSGSVPPRAKVEEWFNP